MYNTLRVTLEGEVWKLTLQCSLSASVYNGIKQYKCKMDLTSLPSNQVQLLTEENPPQKKKSSITQIKCFMVKLQRLDREKQSYSLICNLVSLKLNITFQLYCSQNTICIILLSFSIKFVPIQSLAPLDFPTSLICLDIHLPYKACPEYKAQSPNHITFPAMKVSCTTHHSC